MTEQNPFDTPAACQMTVWALQLAQSAGFRWLLLGDPHLFALLYASCAAAVAPPAKLVVDQAPGEEAGEQVLPILKDMLRQFGQQAGGRFARLYLQGVGVFELIERDDALFGDGVREWRSAAEIEASRLMTAQDRNVDRLADLLELSVLERRLLAFQLGCRRPGFKQLFEKLMDDDRPVAGVIGAALDVAPSEVVTVLSDDAALVRSGILSVEESPLEVTGPSTHLYGRLTEPADDDAGFIARFVRPLKIAPSTASLGRLHADDERILLGVLSRPLPDLNGLHVLVHGPKSVDKLDLLARMLEAESIEARAVVSKRVPSGDMPTWTYIAQRHLERTAPDAVLVVDRAHEALASRRVSAFSFLRFDDDYLDSEIEERVSDEGLTHSRVRCVWVTDHAAWLSERNLGAFLFHCEALPGSRADRRRKVAQLISDLGLTEELERELTKYQLLSEQQVRQAAELARLLARDEADQSTEAREQIVRRAVAHSQKVLGREQTEGLRDSVTDYSLELLNTEGRFTAAQIIAALRKRPKGSLCFWGIPGAGKTQLAEHIAVELDLPIIMKSASDLLSKWLGESEQNIAAMFSEAEAEGALLFLDEADSFLRDRALARAEWSVTQVNELLQRMERFEGVFIAATNLMEAVDPAAMRRFTWKIEFKALRDEQAWSMFCRESGFDPAGDERRAEDLRTRLAAIPDLAPGDFATVKRQAIMLDEQLDPDAWIEQLAAEAKAKMFGLRRQRPGFS